MPSSQQYATSTPVINDDRRSLKEERIGSLLRLPIRERVIKTIPCFMVAEILIQGTMVMTEQHFGFYSSIPGLRRHVTIPIGEICSISKDRVFALFPTAICFRTENEKYVFSYVTSRDRLLQELTQYWQSHTNAANVNPTAAAGAGAAEAATTAAEGVAESNVVHAAAGAAAAAATGTMQLKQQQLATTDLSTSHHSSSTASADSGCAINYTEAATSSNIVDADDVNGDQYYWAARCCTFLSWLLRLLGNRIFWASVMVLIAAVMVLLLHSRLQSLQFKVNSIVLPAANDDALITSLDQLQHLNQQQNQQQQRQQQQQQQQQQKQQHKVAEDLNILVQNMNHLQRQLALLRQSLSEMLSKRKVN